MPSTAGTGTTDLYPSQTAVSFYFTASGPQGEGAITGSDKGGEQCGGEYDGW